jgi:hypothetical protein
MPTPPTDLLHTEIGLLFDEHLRELVDELSEIRAGHFDFSSGTALYDFLTLFFLPGDQTKFTPIRPSELVVCRLLTSKVDQLKGTQIQDVVFELVPLADSHQDNHGHQKLHIALNQLLKPICRTLQKQKTRAKPGRYR